MGNPAKSEYQEQCAVIRWARMMAETNQEPRLAYLHGDYGNQLNVQGGVKRKAAGRVKGWPDLFLPVAQYLNYWQSGDDISELMAHGLFIELKFKGGKTNSYQIKIHDFLRSQGYYVVICQGADAAIKILKEYLGL